MSFFSKKLAMANYCFANYAHRSRRHRIKPTTRAIFAFEAAYLLGTIAMVGLGVIARCGHRFSDQVLIGVLLVIVIFVTQAHGEYLRNMKNFGVFRDYGKLSDKQKTKYAWLGAIVLVGSLVMVFVFGVLFFEGYGDLSRMPGRF